MRRLILFLPITTGVNMNEHSSSLGMDLTWDNVRVMITEDDSLDCTLIRGCLFMDSIIISKQNGSCSYHNSITLPCGIVNTVLKNVIIYPNCCLFQNTLVENSVVLSGSIIMGCGRVTCQSRKYLLLVN